MDANKILTVGMITIGSLNRILLKKSLNKMENYVFFISLLLVGIYIPIFFAIVWYFQLFTNRITPAMLSFPKYKFYMIGGLGAIANFLLLFGAALTPGPIQLLISQLSLPLTMLISIIIALPSLSFIFGRSPSPSFKWNNYLGAAVILSGVFTAIIPQIIHSDSLSKSSTTGLIVYTLSTLPLVSSTLLKEVTIKRHNIDSHYVSAWTCLAQFVITALLYPLTTLPQFGGRPLSDTPSYFVNGFKCLCGTSTLISDRCEGAYWTVGTYIFMNIIFNLVLLALLTYGSVASLTASFAVVLPLTNILFATEWFMGDQATTFKVEDLIALVIVLSGLVLYRYNEWIGTVKPKTKKE